MRATMERRHARRVSANDGFMGDRRGVRPQLQRGFEQRANVSFDDGEYGVRRDVCALPCSNGQARESCEREPRERRGEQPGDGESHNRERGDDHERHRLSDCHGDEGRAKGGYLADRIDDRDEPVGIVAMTCERLEALPVHACEKLIPSPCELALIDPPAKGCSQCGRER